MILFIKCFRFSWFNRTDFPMVDTNFKLYHFDSLISFSDWLLFCASFLTCGKCFSDNITKYFPATFHFSKFNGKTFFLILFSHAGSKRSKSFECKSIRFFLSNWIIFKLHFYFHSFYAEILAINWENVRQRIFNFSKLIFYSVGISSLMSNFAIHTIYL